MKKFLLFTAALCCFTVSQAQLTGLELETVMVHGDVEIPTVTGTVNLNGYTTYRIYAVTTNADDYVSAVYGDGAEVTFLQVDDVGDGADMWQSEFGGATSNDISCAFYDIDLSLIYDSWVTIGKIDNCTDGTLTAIGGNDVDMSFTDTFEETGAFELSGVTGGLWFTLNDVNALGAPDVDNKVLLGQFTALGCLNGEFWVQTFINGDGANIAYQNFAISSCGSVLGCTDATALNYNALATADNGSCLFPCEMALDGEIIATGPTCSYLENGTIQLDVTGNQEFAEYTIVGSGDNPLAIGNFTGLPNGIYTIQVVDAVCGSEEYPEYEALTFEVEVLTPEIDIDISVVQNVQCFNAEDAILTGTVTGGTPPIMYGLTEGDYTQDNLDFIDVDNGTQIVFAQDANGCLAESNAVVVTSPFLFNATGITFAASCFDSEDGTLQMSYSGGTGSPADICWSVDGADEICGQNIFNDIASGPHTIVATDLNGCTSTVELVIASPDEITLDLLVEDGVSCNGDSDGSTEFGAIGGNGTFLYDFGGMGNSTVTSYGDLAAGDFPLVVTDGNDCTADFTITIPEPDVVSFTVNVTDISCNGENDGAIEIVDADGGTAPFTYGIDGANYDDPNLFTGLSAGDAYEAGVTDANGCEVTETVEVVEPDAISIDAVTSSDESTFDACDGSISVTIAGGTGGYTISWSGPDSYTGSGEDITDLCPGDYFISIEDENGCTFDNGGDAVEEILITVEELDNGVNMVVFPNPSNGQYVLNLEGLSGEKITYDILDMSGRIVESVETVASAVNYTRQLDLTGEADGMYLMNLVVGDVSATARLIKQ